MSIERRSVSVRIKLVSTLILLAALLMACGPGDKSRELTELERLRGEGEFFALQQRTPQAIEPVERNYKYSVEAWQEGEEELSAEYAEIAVMYYRAAELRGKEAMEREKLSQIESRLREYAVKIEETKKEIERSTNAIARMQQQTQQMGQVAGSSRAAIIAAEGARTRADAVNARQIAPGDYARAEQTLKMAQDQATQGKFAEADRLAQEAQAAFEAAHNAANPAFARGQQSQALIDEAKRRFSTDAIQQGQAMRLVLPRLFENGEDGITRNKLFLVEEVASLAKQFETATLVIEGYTNDGGRDSRNMTLSQRRADAVLAVLTGKGIASNRITTVAYGEDNPRFDNDSRDDKGKNDRVEVVITIPQDVPARP